MKRIYTSIILILVSIALTGCQNMSKQDAGTITGAVAGGLVGSTIGNGTGQVMAIAAGTLAGAFIGNAVGKSMDDTDRMKMNQACQAGLPTPPSWTDYVAAFVAPNGVSQ